MAINHASLSHDTSMSKLQAFDSLSYYQSHFAGQVAGQRVPHLRQGAHMPPNGSSTLQDSRMLSDTTVGLIERGSFGPALRLGSAGSAGLRHCRRTCTMPPGLCNDSVIYKLGNMSKRQPIDGNIFFSTPGGYNRGRCSRDSKRGRSPRF